MSAEIPDLVKQFSKQAGCTRYTHDTDKLDLLTDYIWLWQLTPNLPFETFLEKYKAVADHDDANLKHPAAAMRVLCPRTQASSSRLNRQQWTAAQLADFTMLYVDMIRAADAEHVPVPLSFSVFLKNLGPQYLAGTFPPPLPGAPAPTVTPPVVVASPPQIAPLPAAPPQVVPPQTAPSQTAPSPTAPTPGTLASAPLPAAQPAPAAAPPAAGAATPAPRARQRRNPAAAAAAAAPVTQGVTPGQRVIYTNSASRQRVGVAEAVEADPATGRTYVTFVDVGGERFDGIAIESIRPATEADGPLPTAPVGPRVATTRLTIPRAHYPGIASVLGLKQPCGTCQVGGIIYSFEATFDQAVAPGVVAHLEVVNGENGPYVDAYLQDAHGNTFADVPPRENAVGTYSFTTDKGVYEMTVVSRGIEAETPAGAPAA